MTNQYKNNASQQGSTLIGVALLTLVMGFLMTGGIYLINTYDAVNKDIKSSETTANLQEAVKNFAGIHKRYPCPAPIDLAPDAPGFGLEDCGISNVAGRVDELGNPIDVKIGAVPVRTLNVPDHMIIDGFGKRHVYAVTTNMTANDGSADVVNGHGAITIMHVVGSYEETLSDIEGYVVYALMSPGEDDRGAFDINGKEILPCEVGTIAGENCDNDATFYTTLKSSVGDSTDFTHNFAFVANTPAHYWNMGQWSECGKKFTKGNPSSQSKWNGSGSNNESEYGNTAAKPVCFASNQERQVVCRDKQGNDVANEECNHTKEPVDFRSCAIGPCRWKRLQPSCSGGSTPEPEPPTRMCTKTVRGYDGGTNRSRGAAISRAMSQCTNLGGNYSQRSATESSTAWNVTGICEYPCENTAGPTTETLPSEPSCETMVRGDSGGTTRSESIAISRAKRKCSNLGGRLNPRDIRTKDGLVWWRATGTCRHPCQ